LRHLPVKKVRARYESAGSPVAFFGIQASQFDGIVDPAEVLPLRKPNKVWQNVLFLPMPYFGKFLFIHLLVKKALFRFAVR
jgi:hypothetical protein